MIINIHIVKSNNHYTILGDFPFLQTMYSLSTYVLSRIFTVEEAQSITLLTFLPQCKVMSKTNLRWRRKRKFPKVKLTILFITNVPYCSEQCESPQLVPIRSIPKACNMFKNKTRKERNKKMVIPKEPTSMYT